MTFTCKKCGWTVSHSTHDNIAEITNGHCLLCWTVIFDKAYPKPKNKVTIFAACGPGLGDNILFNVIREQYEKDNPEETVIYLKESDNHVEAIKKHNPGKFFQNEFYKEEMKGYINSCIVYYRLMNEVCEYAKAGIYPKLDIEFKSVNLPFDLFVVLNLRYIEKAPQKNVMPELGLQVIETLIRAGKNVVIVGNDEKTVQVTSPQVCDLRGVLTLSEIAYLCQRSELYVGRDSGLVHVAAAAGAKIFAWDFNGTRWFPKTGKLYTALTESRHAEILNRLKDCIGGIYERNS